MAIDPATRRAALIATAVTVPLIVVVALLLGGVTGDSDPNPTPTTDARAALSFAAPPRAAVDAASCAKVLAQLPVTLGRLQPRVVRTTPDTPFVVAWGDPAVVLRCGVARPAALRAGSSESPQAAGPVSGPYYFVTGSGDGNVWTTIDRAAYISVTVPSKYQGADVLPPLSNAIAQALPQVCNPDGSAADLSTLCTRRK